VLEGHEQQVVGCEGLQRLLLKKVLEMQREFRVTSDQTDVVYTRSNRMLNCERSCQEMSSEYSS